MEDSLASAADGFLSLHAALIFVINTASHFSPLLTHNDESQWQ
ncbi:hypothetical protein SOHN41_02456 [Shewanella sp. HN-41]|nr:hypothetical protein SOHN41_02456 [Shewanella sp. HN-41]